MRRLSWCSLALLAPALGLGCRGDAGPVDQPASPPPIVEVDAEEEEFPIFEPIDPDTVEPLEVVFLPREEGPGYPRVPV